MISQKIPPQFILIDGMTSIDAPIRFCPSTKPFYFDHDDLIRLRIEVEYSSPNPSSPSLSSLFFDQISSLNSPINDHIVSKMIISFGYIYLLQYPEQYSSNDPYPKRLDCLLTKHFLPPLYDTFFPSTILERIEINRDNSHCLQQIFSRKNRKIKREVISSVHFRLLIVFSTSNMMIMVYI